MTVTTNSLVATTKRLAIPTGVAATVLLGGTFLLGHRSAEAASSAAAPLDDSRVSSLVALDDAVEAVAARVTPAVVSVSVTAKAKEDNSMPDGSQGQAQIPPGLRQFFFGSPFQGQGQGMTPEPQIEHGIGSGIIISPDGYILTNGHVVAGATQIRVTMHDRRVFPAKLIGVDKLNDVAVIKVDASNLPSIAWGDSTKLQPGQTVLAFGSPFGYFQFSVTRGIISALDRPNPYTDDPRKPGDFIQTDAAINPGNSGGPLLNMNGEVIGVNTAIFTQSAGYQGIGFAMPSNTVASVYNDLVSPSHKVTRGSIGIQFREGLSGAVNRVYGFKNGVLVQEVQPGGPADKAGLKPGDIITAIDGRSIKDGDDLVNEIASRRPGSTARLGYIRDGKPQDTTVTIGDRDKVFAEMTGQQPPPAPDDQGDAGETTLGIVVREASPATQAKIHGSGMVIQSVRTGSFADLQGLAPGLVITRINKQSTATKAEYDGVVKKLKTGDDVVFEVIDPRHPEAGINYIGGTLQ